MYHLHKNRDLEMTPSNFQSIFNKAARGTELVDFLTNFTARGFLHIYFIFKNGREQTILESLGPHLLDFCSHAGHPGFFSNFGQTLIFLQCTNETLDCNKVYPCQCVCVRTFVQAVSDRVFRCMYRYYDFATERVNGQTRDREVRKQKRQSIL